MSEGDGELLREIAERIKEDVRLSAESYKKGLEIGRLQGQIKGLGKACEIIRSSFSPALDIEREIEKLQELLK